MPRTRPFKPKKEGEISSTHWFTDQCESLASVQEIFHEDDTNLAHTPRMDSNESACNDSDSDVDQSWDEERTSVNTEKGTSESRSESVPRLREVIDRFKGLGLESLGLQMLTASTSHVLQGAHHFVMNSPVFLNLGNSGDESMTMRLLAEHKLSGAEMDSFSRYPPPSCHPGTRHTIQTSVISWLMDINRKSSLLWLHGAAGVGKSAVAQTISEYCMDKKWLGAALFLSRPKNQDAPPRIIPSFAYQLAVRFPAYKEIISRLLADEPSIFDKNLHIQFTKMIIEPLSRLGSKLETSQPILMLLDGLDECKGDQAQQSLIELIGGFSAISHALTLPFVWIIASRPEWQIVSAFSKVEKIGHLWKEELCIHTFEARNDVAAFLRDGFEGLRARYSDVFAPGTAWPKKEQFMVIRSFASGLFVFASTILDFVGDEEVGDPVLQMELCLAFFKGTLLSPTGNPLDPLEALYSGILGTIHCNALPTTLQILSALRFSSGTFSAQTLANFLGLSQATFYSSLRKLYSVLIVPSPNDAGRAQLQIRHASFEGFLGSIMDSSGLGPSTWDVTAHICRACVRWLGLRGTMVRHAQTIGLRTEYLSVNVPWNHPRSFHNIITFLGREIWPLLSRRAENDMVQLYQDLHHFDFASYDRIYSPYDPTYTFEGHAAHVASLFSKLYLWQSKSPQTPENLLRLKPDNTVDHNLYEHYACILRHCGAREADFTRILSAPQQYSFLCFSDTKNPAAQRFRQAKKALLDPLAMFFLVGYESRTCLVIAYRPAISVKQFLVDAFQNIRAAYRISTSCDGTTWPLPQHVDLIASTAVLPPSSDSSEQELMLQSSIIRSITTFIADPQHSDPVGRLEQVVDILAANNSTRSQILDRVHKQIFDDIPNHIRPTVNKILSFSMHHVTCNHDRLRTIVIEDLVGTGVTDRELVESAIKTVNLISNRPLLFTSGSVLDFGLSDIPPYTISSEHYPWCHTD